MRAWMWLPLLAALGCRPGLVDPPPPVDEDDDGVTAEWDCDDADPGRFVGNMEVAYDGVDQDCDGFDLVDVDGDTFAGVGRREWERDAASAWPEDVDREAFDCDDADEHTRPGATDSWYDGVDADCDGANDYDQDGDGYAWDEAAPPDLPGGDCTDWDAAVHPGAPDEAGDGVDADCDGADD